MNPIKALIIDDEPLAHKVILQYANDIPFLEVIGQSYLATEAYAQLKRKDIDLIFLDIQMPKLKGLDFLRTLDKKPQVIVTSAYQEYALEGFELQICDYLLKPFRFDRFLKAVNKAQQQVTFLKQENQTPPPFIIEESQDKEIFIKVDKRFIKLNINDIQYLESYGNYVKIWVENEFHLTPRTLSSFETEFGQTQFLKIHKSFIIQRSYVDYVEGNKVVMKNGKELAIGKNHKADVKGWLSK